jgi:hypothetical protein
MFNDLNGRIDANTNGSGVEGGLFPQELVTRYPLIVIKCNSLSGQMRGRDSKEEWVGGVPGPPSYFTRRGDGILVPGLQKLMQNYKNLLILNIPSKTITNSFLVMNSQIWTKQKRHLSTTNAAEQVSALCAYATRWRTPCTSCLNVHSACRPGYSMFQRN